MGKHAELSRAGDLGSLSLYDLAQNMLGIGAPARSGYRWSAPETDRLFRIYAEIDQMGLVCVRPGCSVTVPGQKD